MGLVHNWVDAGNGILLQHQEPKRSATDLVEFCEGIGNHDMLYIKLQHPEDFPATVDLGVAPHIIRQSGHDEAVLLAQATNLHFILENYIQLSCNCHDEINDDWYTVEIVIDRAKPAKTEAEFFKRYQPIKNFGGPAPDMQKAFAEYRRRVHSSEK